MKTAIHLFVLLVLTALFSIAGAGQGGPAGGTPVAASGVSQPA